MTKEAKEKSKIRRSAKWKKFRGYLKKKRKVDEITLSPLYKGFQVHHKDLHFENYAILNPDNFSTLNRKSHDFIHWLYNYYSKDKKVLDRIKNILDDMIELNKE